MKAHQQLYGIYLTKHEWEEVWALSFEPFEYEEGECLTRGQWMAICDMLFGKAHRMDLGDYDWNEAEDGVDTEKWATELRQIAEKIRANFRPGDGRI